MAFYADLVDVAAIYGLVAIAFNLLIGYTGLFSVAPAAIFGLGAYTFALLELRNGVGLVPAAAAAVAAGIALGVVSAIPSFRVTGDYLVAASFGLQLVVGYAFENLMITGGAGGVFGIKPFAFFGHTFAGPIQFLWISVTAVVLAALATAVLVRGPLGLVLRAIRDDEIGARALGKQVAAAKVVAFALAGGLTAFAGVLYAGYEQYISPPTFQMQQTVIFLTMILVGGAGTVIGPLFGAALVVGLPQLLLLLPISGSTEAYLGPIVYGSMLVLIAIVRPEGLWSGWSGTWRLARLPAAADGQLPGGNAREAQ